jgi:hypothetical protein
MNFDLAALYVAAFMAGAALGFGASPVEKLIAYRRERQRVKRLRDLTRV